MKGKIARATGIPTTRQGRQRKVGRMATGGGCLIPVAIFLGLIVLLVLLVLPGCSSSTASPTPKYTDIGQTALLDAAGDPEALLGIDKSSYDALGKALLAKDWYGVLELMNNGRVFSVPKDTEVLIIDTGFGVRQVRITEGTSKGRSGWIAVEFLKAP